MSNKKIDEDKTISKMNVDLKKLSNAGNIKNTVDDIRCDFAVLDKVVDTITDKKGAAQVAQ